MRPKLKESYCSECYLKEFREMKATQHFRLLSVEDAVFSVLWWIGVKLLAADTNCNEKILVKWCGVQLCMQFTVRMYGGGSPQGKYEVNAVHEE